MNGKTENKKPKKLSLLGKAGIKYPSEYCPGILEAFENKHPDTDYMVKFNCPEFTSLCPVTGQPDFAAIYINYIPDGLLAESKSLKLYLYSFRNRGDFHENCVNTILKDLRSLLDPKFIEVQGKFLPRGGISIDPYVCWGRPGGKYAGMADYRLQNHDLYFEDIKNR